ncbi:uncharacterized protein LOC111089095 [Limulus polyphemus]|uniref:Uncharacterized protein LOC111089095 n=1 Tax=Limulus polyphemus TaxID=6850 RepID=A0ABM1TL52_LIMPO|nr:uncharacterized protein LOC111089095 [Limulus polyphemus]XP_022256609.1 uncharacterized protein LOC111089095 [Limulus polyphemus]XP_022256610.1 uncharacterized protein LOC111089095 [Limulus polyphemus]
MKVQSPGINQHNGSPRGHNQHNGSPRGHTIYHVPKEKLSRVLFLKIWLGTIVFLFVAGVVLLVLGVVFWQTGLALFLGGLFCLTLAVLTLSVYVWYLRWRSTGVVDKSRKDQNTISTIGNPELYTPAPLQLKSDYPMGPLLIMTLPRTKCLPSSHPLGDAAVESTPDIDRKIYPLKPCNKNLPPLASAETLSPSLTSSVVSIDTAI